MTTDVEPMPMTPRALRIAAGFTRQDEMAWAMRSSRRTVCVMEQGGSVRLDKVRDAARVCRTTTSVYVRAMDFRAATLKARGLIHDRRFGRTPK